MGRRKVGSQGSVYRDGKWWVADVVVGWRQDGRPIRRKAKRATRDEAQDARAKLVQQRNEGRLATDARAWTVEKWMWHWLSDHAGDQDLAPGTRDRYATAVRAHIAPQIGAVRLDQFSAKHAAKVQRAMREAGLAASTRKQAHIALNLACKAAVSEGVLGMNPMTGVKPPRVVPKQIQPPDASDVAAIYGVIGGRRDEVRWLLALEYGVRQGETLGLTMDSVDLDRGLLKVTHQLQRIRGRHGCGTARKQVTRTRKAWPCRRAQAEFCTKRTTGRDGQPKHGCGTLRETREVWPCGHTWASKCPDGVAGRLVLRRLKTARARRDIVLDAGMVELLRAHMTRMSLEEAALDERRPWDGEVDGKRRRVRLLFCQENGDPIDPSRDYDAWMDVIAAAGLGHHRVHDARHAAVVGMLDDGASIRTISDVVGHASVAFTMQVYGSTSSQAAREAADRIGARRAARRGGGDLTSRRAATS
jgi:integrase